MAHSYLAYGGSVLAIDHPHELGDAIVSMMGLESAHRSDVSPLATVAMVAASPGRYIVRDGDSILGGDLLAGDAIMTAWRHGVVALADALPRPSIVLHAASLARNGVGILVPGRSGRGKSSLTAWLMKQGYLHLSDDVAALLPDGRLTAIYGPLFIRPDVWPLVSSLDLPGQHLDLEGGGRLLQPQAKADTPSGPLPLKLILLPAFSRSKSPNIELLPPARAAMALMGQNHSARGVENNGLGIAVAAARGAVALRLTYGSYDEIDGVLQPVLDRAIESGSAGLAEAIAKANGILLARRNAASVATETTAVVEVAPTTTGLPRPSATPRRDMKPRLTIGMATYDDYHGVYFTVQALRMYHPEVMAETEIIVIDNHPEGEVAPLLKKIDTEAPNYRYIPYTEKSGTAAGREHLFAEAAGEFVLCMDCHVFFVPQALSRLMSYMRDNPMTGDLLQGPLLYDDQKSISTHWVPAWREGMFGTWETDKRAQDINAWPFEIPMMGLGVFACRKDAWQHFNLAFRGFGGEEGYIHEKFRQAGHRTLCLPFLRWLHRFGRPGGTPYPNAWDDRIHNYYVGHRELGLDTGEMEAHFSKHLGAENFARIQQQLGFAPAKATATT